MILLYLLVLVLLVKIVLIDSPVGKALGDAISNVVPPRAPEGSASRADLELLRRDIEELGERLDRVVEEQVFLTRLLAEPRRLSLGPGKAGHSDTAD